VLLQITIRDFVPPTLIGVFIAAVHHGEICGIFMDSRLTAGETGFLVRQFLRPSFHNITTMDGAEIYHVDEEDQYTDVDLDRFHHSLHDLIRDRRPCADKLPSGSSGYGMGLSSLEEPKSHQSSREPGIPYRTCIYC